MMRAWKSYGLAAILVLGLAAWLLTGVLVQGGKGPVEGEQSVVHAIEGADGGPLTTAVAATGLGHEAKEHGDAALSIAERNAAKGTTDAPARSVRSRGFAVQSMPLRVTLRGQTQAKAVVNAVAKTADTVAAVAVTEGQAVRGGDLLCRLQAGTRQASVDQAQAAVAQADAALAKAEADYATNASLRAKGLASANSAEGVAADVSAAKANRQAATVALDNARMELEHIEIRAPVPGVIQRPLAKLGDSLAMGGVCAAVVQLDPMVFTGAVPQARIDLARLGLVAEVTTITGAKAMGKVSYIAVAADAATRSFPVEIEFANPGGRIKDGLTAEATVEMGAIPAHLLPQSVLTLQEDGGLGVQTVQGDKVVFRPVTIVQDTRDGVWVTGLPAQVDIIILGQEYVTDGDVVAATRTE